MKYAFFLGCIIPNRYPAIEVVTKRILRDFGVNLLEMHGASCCPAPGVFGSLDLKTWLSLAARNISIAEELGVDIMTMCNGCYGSLKEANHLLKANKELKEVINEVLAEVDKEFKGSIEVKHQVEIFSDVIGIEKIKNAIVKNLNLKVAAHYGCHFLKPTEIKMHGTAERPRMLDNLIEATGASSIQYKDKMMCCGFGGGVRTREIEVALDFTREKIINMKKAGAECMVNQCASCHLEFDRGQIEIKNTFGEDFRLPVLYYTQLLGLALGFKVKELGLQFHNIPVKLERMGII